jgi:hypothetical protein
MIDRLVHGLAAGTDLDAEEILDVLWLSAAYPVAQAEQAGSGDSAPHGEPHGEETGSRSDEPSPTRDVLPLYLESRREDGGDARPATAIGFDAPRPLQKVATLPMAVRRLRKVVAPGPRLVVDIDATVEATAEATRLMPVLTRPPQRALDLALVVDDSPSMRIWHDVLDDLERLLAQTSAFRSVSRWRLAAGKGAIRPYAPHRNDDQVPAAPLGRPEQLVDPSGRRLVLIATDARDRSWYDEVPWDAIETWCAAMPTVLVQVLPPQYWVDTAVGTPYMTSRALTPAAPNGQYQHRLAWWTAGADPGGLPLPVVTLAEKSLDAWAQSIVNGTVWASGITATAPAPGSAPPNDDEADADVAVNDFLAKATPGAQRLARILASADTPLSMPLISVLRERLAPETGVAELAEIMASGLLETAGPANGTEQPLLRYRAGTRPILYRGTSAFEDWDALAAVGKYLEDRRQVGGSLRILVPDAAGSAELDTADQPFHEFQHALAVRYGLRSAGSGLPGSTADLVEVALATASGPAQEQREAAAVPWSGDPTADATVLSEVLAAELAGLGAGQQVTVAAFEADGITIWRVRRDENGIPQDQKSVLATSPLSDPAAFYAQQLAPSLGDYSRLLIVRGSADESLSAVFSLLRTRSGAPAFDCEEPFEEVLRQAIRNTPLTCWYDLVVLREAADGQLSLDAQPLFQPGATSGDRTEPFLVECAPADQGGTVFAVVSRSAGQEPDQVRRVQARSAVIPPAVYQVTALLSGPGDVQFDGLPASLSTEQRPLAGLISQVPERLQTPEPIHLVCLIEASGDQIRLGRRIDRLEQLIAAADTGRRPLAVSVISYGPHSVARYMTEEPATVRTWITVPDLAIRALRGLLDRDAPEPRQEYSRAAQAECALDALSQRIYRRAGRPIVVTVGARPSHPPRVDIHSEIIPCPRRVDWRTVLGRLREIQGIRFGALCDPDAIGEIWRDLGRDAFAVVDNADIPRFAAELGLREPPQAVPFPLVVPATAGAAKISVGRSAAHGDIRGSGVAKIAVLGPVGSGTTTFLAALNMTLIGRSHGSGLRGSDVPSIRALAEMTDLLATRGEFPPPTQGTDWFEWTLIQQGTPPSDISAQPPAATPLRLTHPAGEFLHPAVGGSERRMLLRDLAAAQGIIYMLDPIREIDVGDAFEIAGNLLRQLRQQAASTEADSSGGELPQYVAVCLTKFDEPRILDGALRQGVVTTHRDDPFGFPRVADANARDFVAGLSAISGGSGVQSLLSTFDKSFRRGHVRYFITSAIGFYTDPETGKFNADDPANIVRPATGTGRPTIRGAVHPINVVEPLLWLAGQIAGT